VLQAVAAAPAGLLLDIEADAAVVSAVREVALCMS